MGKARIIDTNLEYIVIPGASRERILTQPSPHIHCMEEHNILIAGISHLTPGYRAARFPSYYNMILYCHAGSAQIDIGDHALTIHPSEVMIGSTGQTFSYHPITKQWDISWIHLVDCPEWSPLFSPGVTVRKSQWANAVHRLMENYVDEATTRNPDSQHMLRLCTDMLVGYLKRELGTEDPELIGVRESLQNLWRKIHADLAHRWTVDEMAAEAGLCKTRLNRLCSKLHNATPMNMVATMRMERGAEMLAFSNYTLAMIADEIGYENGFGFSKAFKQYAGISPKEYRQRRTQAREQQGHP